MKAHLIKYLIQIKLTALACSEGESPLRVLNRLLLITAEEERGEIKESELLHLPENIYFISSMKTLEFNHKEKQSILIHVH